VGAQDLLTPNPISIRRADVVGRRPAAPRRRGRALAPAGAWRCHRVCCVLPWPSGEQRESLVSRRPRRLTPDRGCCRGAWRPGLLERLSEHLTNGVTNRSTS
jgi:hypothetical protein